MPISSPILDRIQTGDILLSRDKDSPVSTVIAGVTKSNWSHSSLYIGAGKVIESNWDGVEITPLGKYLKGDHALGLFRAKPELTEDETKRLIKEARAMLGINYGWLKMLWLGFLRFIGKSEDPDWAMVKQKGVICSELIAKAYKRIGRPLKDLPPRQVEPADYDNNPLTTRIA